VLAYPVETILAEKLEAIVSLGMLTSRMKDYFDVYAVVTTFELAGQTIVQAVRATFTGRNTPIPATTPEVLGGALAADAVKQRQWQGILSGIERNAPSLDLETVTAKIREFTEPLFERARTESSDKSVWVDWSPDRGWR
jgi:nucleotidyltransferase AbiEii toxin of type IV toxin-antitoxin system